MPPDCCYGSVSVIAKLHEGRVVLVSYTTTEQTREQVTEKDEKNLTCFVFIRLPNCRELFFALNSACENYPLVVYKTEPDKSIFLVYGGVKTAFRKKGGGNGTVFDS